MEEIRRRVRRKSPHPPRIKTQNRWIGAVGSIYDSAVKGARDEYAGYGLSALLETRRTIVQRMTDYKSVDDQGRLGVINNLIRERAVDRSQ